MSEKGRTVEELAARVGGRVLGDGAVRVKRVAALSDAAEGDVAFVDDARLIESVKLTRASCIIVPEGAQVDAPCVIEAARPKLSFALIAELLHPQKKLAPSRHPTAIISESAEVDESVYVGPYVTIGERTRVGSGTMIHAGASLGDDVTVGSDSVLHPKVVLYDNVTIGSRVVLHASVIIGADGFGYVPDEENRRHKFPQIGTVLIEDDVEIGAGTCV
ncbi:MAG TPA: LpxD N-terminal domain-containing protein, partial [Pyrinomonadaceae bacterium]|nr:LpxD N-terminal domain-containing protein [Pyrinomonadaceae bacterium]